jgi:crotonobetainyl-CoA:carnitine CoA-transferase CaiB-like acyl-CoA transferase
LTLGALEGKFWANLCRLLGREDLVPLQHVTGRERDRVEAELRGLFRTRPRDAWVELLGSADVCAGPVLSLDEVVGDPHLQARRLFHEVRHPTLGALPQVAFPVKLSATPPREATPPPDLGADTAAVLAEIGYDRRALVSLKDAGIV